MDEQVNPLEREHSLSVVLPGGQERNATVHGSTPVMDLLVTLCASYHLNPSDYTVEVLSANKNNISFKPNSPVGSLEADTVVLKPKGVEEKIKRPYIPEATVRLLINYNKSHKAVVRVSPRVPMEMLLPVICDKCELKAETTVLLRESQSKELLDLTKTLNELGLREVFAKDTAAKEHVDPPRTPEAAVTPAEVISPPPPQDLPKKEKKQKENAGFLGLFRRRKKKTETDVAGSAPASPVFNKPASTSVKALSVSSSSNTPPTDKPKKRRAPQPPASASQSAADSLRSCHQTGAQRSVESALRSTKRRAPPPPCANTHQELQTGAEVEGSVDALHTLEERRESAESDSVNLSLSPPSSPHPSQPLSFSFSSRPSLAHLHEMADPYLPTFRGKDISDARSALAKVLTSSISKATLVRRLKSSATFPKMHNTPAFMSVTPKRPDYGDSHAELESVLKSKLPTETEWEDPAHRKGMTTFKVVPSNKKTFHEDKLTLDVPEQYQITLEDNHDGFDLPEDRDDQIASDEDSCPPDRADTGTPSPSPEPCSQEILTSDRPASPAAPPDLDVQDRPGSPLPEVDDIPEEEEEEEEEPGVAEAPSSCGDEELTGQIVSESLSEYPQSPRARSPSTNAERCGSRAFEEEGEEVVQEKEEEDSFPPPPPPTFYNEDIEVLPCSESQSPTWNASAAPDQFPATTAPLDKMSTAPSRFAQAVAQAVQKRTRLLSRGKGFGSLAAALPSKPTSAYQFGA